jgi:hypothetical protein
MDLPRNKGYNSKQVQLKPHFNFNCMVKAASEYPVDADFVSNACDSCYKALYTRKILPVMCNIHSILGADLLLYTGC